MNTMNISIMTYGRTQGVGLLFVIPSWNDEGYLVNAVGVF